MLLVIASLYNFVAAQTSKKAESGIKQLKKQHTPNKTAFVTELTAQDRANYLLKIDQSKIGKPGDTVLYRRKYKVLYKRKYKVFNIPVKLLNLSNDTLRYLSVYCSWYDFFSIDNKKISILGWGCDSNIPIDKIVLPHKTGMYNIPVLTDGTIINDKFRIGMNLFIINKENRNYSLNYMEPGDRAKNLIWSNEVTLR